MLFFPKYAALNGECSLSCHMDGKTLPQFTKTKQPSLRLSAKIDSATSYMVSYQDYKVGALIVPKINLAAITTDFDPVINTFNMSVIVAQANKASVGID